MEVKRRVPLLALVAGSGVSLTGNVIASVAIPWFVLTTTGSAALTGVAAFAATVPNAVGSLIAGRVVDLLGAKRTSIASDLFSGLCVAAIPVLHALGVLQLWHLLGLTFAGAVFDSAGMTARQAMIPEVAGASGASLERASSLHGGTEHLGYLIGAPLAGLLIAAVGAPAALWVDAATFAVSAALIALAIPARLVRGVYATAAPVGLRQAVEFLRRDQVVLVILVNGTIGSLLINPVAPLILPIYAHSVLQSPVALGLSVAAYGLGGLVGTGAFGAVLLRLPRVPVYVGAFALAVFCFAALSLLPPLALLLVGVFALGFLAGSLTPLEQTVRFERTPPELRPRVLGLTTASWMIVGPLSVLLTGGLIDRLGLQTTLLAITVGQIALSLFVALHPATRRLDETRGGVAAPAHAR